MKKTSQQYLNSEAHGYLMEAKACKLLLKDLERIRAKLRRHIEKEAADREAEFKAAMQYHSESDIQEAYGWEFISEQQYERYEEHILNKIMEALADEPELDHIALPLSDDTLPFPELEIRLKEQAVFCRGQLVTLTHHEFAVLAYLARHPGWVFSASQIYEAVWAADGEHCGTAVASVIGQIRRKLTPDTPKGGYIRTVLGSGYKFNSSPF